MVWVDDPVEVLDSRRPTARTEHTCAECSRTVKPGETYLREAYVWEGDFSTYKRCPQCDAFLRAADSLLNERRTWDEGGFTIGCIYDLDPCVGTAGELIESEVTARELVERVRDLALGGWEGIAPEWVSGLLVVDNGAVQPSSAGGCS